LDRHTSVILGLWYELSRFGYNKDLQKAKSYYEKAAAQKLDPAIAALQQLNAGMWLS
jgi:TPR repeat protein